MSESPKILEIKNATVYRGATKVFDGLSLEIAAATHTAILGPNGAGKTTLLRLITRDLYPVFRPGSWVRVLGRERWNVSELRAQLGIVSPELQARHQRQVRGADVVLSGFFSSVGLYPHLLVTPVQREKAAALMQSLQISRLGGRFFVDLSEGEQRRFLLARALISDPGVLILDEPTSGLDLRGTFEILAHLRRLARAGTTLVLVTHRVSEIPPEVETVVLLKEGRVWAQGAKREMLTAENLSNLFEVRLHLVEEDGYYQVMPG